MPRLRLKRIPSLKKKPGQQTGQKIKKRKVPDCSSPPADSGWSYLYYQAQPVNEFLTNHPICTQFVKNVNLVVNYMLTTLSQERIIRAKMRKTVLKLWTGGVTQW